MTFSTIYSVGDNEFSSTHFQRIQYRLEFFFNAFLKISLVTPLNEGTMLLHYFSHQVIEILFT